MKVVELALDGIGGGGGGDGPIVDGFETRGHLGKEVRGFSQNKKKRKGKKGMDRNPPNRNSINLKEKGHGTES